MDSWAAAEQSRLLWISKNQKSLWVEMYQQLVDAFSAGDNPPRPNDLGKKLFSLLPSKVEHVT